MTTIRVLVPEAYALDDQGNQLDKMVIKHANTQLDMEPQLSTFSARWSHEACAGCGDDSVGFLGLCKTCLEELEELANA